MKSLLRFKSYLIYLLLISISFNLNNNEANSLPIEKNKKIVGNINHKILKDINKISTGQINWKKVNSNQKVEKSLIWKKLKTDFDLKNYIDINNIRDKSYVHNVSLHSFNRSLVFSDKIVGPDISWLVPSGLRWNKKYKFDASVRGHNRRKMGEPFLKWNAGDAVGQFYYQPIVREKYSFGLNIGMRSVYQGSAIGGTTSIGEGLSGGFRLDRKLSNTAGIAFGAEQLLHFDGLTDTGRDIYLTATKAFWTNNIEGIFPLDIFTAGIGTGKLAEGNVKMLCSNLLGGSGTETFHQRRLCWSPIFSISRVFNKNFSTIFEYNSKDFILGASYIPYSKIPLRGSFAVVLSDHIDNYKIHNFDEMRWVFRLSLGF